MNKLIILLLESDGVLPTCELGLGVAEQIGASEERDVTAFNTQWPDG